jgi:hypothetical protein
MSTTHHYGFIADPATNFTAGQEPEIVRRLNLLAEELHQNIYGISGYRTPQQSARAGGSTNDPHTRGQAADIGIGSSLRASAGTLTNAQLEAVGLWRPFDLTADNPNEVNHVQILPSDGGPAVPGAREPFGIDLTKPGATKTWREAQKSAQIAKEGGSDAKSGGIAGPTATGPSELAIGIAGKLVGLFGEWFGQAFARAALYVLLVGAGGWLIIAGISRAAGLHPVQAPKNTAMKAAEAGAA